ncbi:MAG: AmmeMemoRadiSam system protein B [Planctomycetes bacterium]|nr:AmmeMemoRadiSam system protein B [Planctomycetota bacterium]
MHLSRPIFNPGWYPVTPDECRRQIEEFNRDFTVPAGLADLKGGLVPHAGWVYSGRVAAHTWKALSDRSSPGTVILFGAVHYSGVHRNAAYPGGSWETPFGPIAVDEELARKLEQALGPLLVADEEAHEQEHSLEVHVPFVKALFPQARILPIAVPPSAAAAPLGRKIGELARGEAVIAVGSTDLTHYGRRYAFAPKGSGPAAHEWMRKNDELLLSLVQELKAEEIQDEVEAHQNACGPGAIAAALAFARAQGKKSATVLEHTTSFDVAPDREFTMAVGYAGVVF